ncbi:MAG: BGTF surface domain-containing protein [Natrialbaceae archaeon]|nr:BGTF surface domain-containing protein [Natrialbaceae archaeon]
MAEANVTVSVTDEEITREFVNSPFTTEQVGYANISINLENTDTAAVRISDWESHWYEVGLSIDASDYDGDVAHIKMNTYLAGGSEIPSPLGLDQQSPLYVFAPHDKSIEVDVEYRLISADSNLSPLYYPDGIVPNSKTLSDMLATGNYEVMIGDEWNQSTLPGAPTSISLEDRPTMKSQDDTAFVEIQQISPNFELAMLRAPESQDVIGQEALEEANLTDASTMVEGEHLIGVVENAGLESAIDTLGRLAIIEDFHGLFFPSIPKSEWTHPDINYNDLGFIPAGSTISQRGYEDFIGVERDGVEFGAVTAEFGDIYVIARLMDLPPTSDHEWNTSGYEDPSQLPHSLRVYNLNLDNYEGDLYVEGDYQRAGIEAGDSIEVILDPTTVAADFADDIAENIGLDPDNIDLEKLLINPVEIDIEEAELAFSPESSEVEASEDATITGTTNLAPGTELDVRASASGHFVKTVETTVTQDASGNPIFQVPMDLSEGEPGMGFDLRVTGPYDSEATMESTMVDGEEEAPASFDIAVDSPTEVTPGEEATLDVTVENTGDIAGESNFTVTIDGETQTDEILSLGSGESTSESFELNTTEEGEISWTVETDDSSDSGTVTVAQEEPPEDTEADEDEESDGEEDGTPGFGVTVAIVALLSIGLLARRVS